MSLIASPRHTRKDLEAWARTESQARAWAGSVTHLRRVQSGRDNVRGFTGGGACYAGVSWGKDSVAVAHVVRLVAPKVPLVWVRVRHVENPDCVLVRDAFLDAYPGPYDEVEVEPGANRSGGTSALGFKEASMRYGPRYVSGVRGEESAQRKRRMMSFGASSKNTCAPIGWWTGLDVFSYLVANNLPIHPAYACTMNGAIDPIRIRVGSLGGGRGTGRGRREWELRYYAGEMRRMAAAGHVAEV